MKKTGSSFRTVFAHIVLILLSFMCLFFFYVLIINATRSHADLQKGFSALPGKNFLENLKNGEVFRKGEKVMWFCRNCGHAVF